MLLIALLLTVLGWHYVRQNVEAQARARFDDITRATQEAIERRTKAYLDAMFGARGLFYASDAVTREEWHNYVEGIEPNKRFEGLQALSYAEYLTPEEREEFVRRAREEGLPELRPDLVPGGERTAYYPITYTGPLDKANRRRVNQDVYADPAHRSVMDAARDSGSPRATGTVNVLTEPSPNSSADLALRPGFVVYLPIYQKGEPLGTVAERRRALQGFIVGSFKSDGLLDGISKGPFERAIDFEVYDGANVASSPLLYDSDGILRGREENELNTASSPLVYDSDHVGPRAKGEGTLFSKDSRLEVTGREWSLYFATLPRFEKGVESNLPKFVLASGGAVSTLLFGITWMLVRSRTRAERASRDLEEANEELEALSSEAQTRYRTLVEQIPAITYVQEPLESSNSKAVTYVSPQYETILGYPPELNMFDEVHWLTTIHPEDRERVLAEEARTDETGEPFKVEYRVIAGDGRVVWLRDEATLVRDEEGQPLYWLGVQYDVTEQKQEAQERERIEQELRVARLIQHTLLPKSLPELPGYDVAVFYRPAEEVGGDFYDFLELPEGRLGLVVGDVTGHGVPAALMMANTQSVLRAVAQRGGSEPGRILAEVNEVLWTYMPPSMFVTCFCGILDPESGRFRYANAGHNLPYSRQEGMAIELRATGMPLGLMPGMSYEEKEITLKSGESVLLYSDGLVEAHDPRREMFGTPRLEGFVGAHPGGATLIDSLLAELE
ncbi:MAG TPA: SpoIIE family protein phosphatase, partial [Rubrobacteraceae bacterium]|nr:SpoIIE family protein phosphatase [Rubrobacteraceae bacterium]